MNAHAQQPANQHTPSSSSDQQRASPESDLASGLAKVRAVVQALLFILILILILVRLVPLPLFTSLERVDE